jgi:preprotein translocase subunit SecD
MASIAGRTGVFTNLLFWVALAAVGSYMIWPMKDRPRKGIDLVGGFYITLKVATDEAVKAELTHTMQGLINDLRDHDIADPSSHKIEGSSIVLQFKTIEESNQAFQAIRDRNDLTLTARHEGEKVRLTLADNRADAIRENAVEGNVDVLHKRLNELGVAEIPVSRQGANNIIIELPSVDNPAEAKALIGKNSHLEIKEVEASAPTEDDLLDKYDGILPEGLMIVSEERLGGAATYYLVPDYTDLTGRDLKSASLGKGQRLEAVVNFEFNSEGTHKFSELTKKQRGRQIAVIVDGKVISAPVANDHIKGGTGYIQGNFTEETAKNLATMLRSGAFSASMSFEEERRIGPSLGAESIKQGLMSCLIGLGLLVLFSLFYYRVAGFLAFLALIYNLLLILFFMYWLNATLTLPGIAGMVLTVGMAIDASVLIYERIKESLAEGMTFKRAVDVGFSEAMVVILDGNITTFIVGLVLYKFGTGPIQGFAITMMLGIIATLLTGLFFLRTLFNVVLVGFNLEKISI